MIYLVIVLAVVGVAAGVAIQLCAKGIIHNNAIIGIRTRQLRSSEAAWEAGHQAATTVVWITAGLCVVVAAASVSLNLSDDESRIVALVLAAVLVVGLALAAFRANKAADTTLSH